MPRRLFRGTLRKPLLAYGFALLSIVFMISFVLLFDRVHIERSHARFIKKCLLSAQDLGRLQRLLAACQEA
ncbi:MAG: hypothetical protein WA830_25125 [Candidatus Sulfotelmatobacter sp.]